MFVLVVNEIKCIMISDLALQKTIFHSFCLGVHTAEHFVKFLEDILYPLTYLHDENEVKKFVSLNDVSNSFYLCMLNLDFSVCLSLSFIIYNVSIWAFYLIK